MARRKIILIFFIGSSPSNRFFLLLNHTTLIMPTKRLSFYRAARGKTFVLANEAKTAGRKKDKSRVTLLVGCLMTGDKVPLALRPQSIRCGQLCLAEKLIARSLTRVRGDG